MRGSGAGPRTPPQELPGSQEPSGQDRRGMESEGTMQEGEEGSSFEGMEVPRGEGRLGWELRRVRE